MQVRRLEIGGIAAGFALGASLTPALLQGDPARLLSTFLGLVSASILPTVSLILATMTTSGRSVHAIDRLRDELASAMDALFLLLGSVGVIFAAIFLLSLPPPRFLQRIPFLTTEILPRAGQASVVAGTILILLRAWQIPAILRRSLTIRHEISVDEARKKTLENAAKVGEVGKIFPRDPSFGQSVKISDLQSKAGH